MGQRKVAVGSTCEGESIAMSILDMYLMVIKKNQRRGGKRAVLTVSECHPQMTEKLSTSSMGSTGKNDKSRYLSQGSLEAFGRKPKK